MGRTAWGAGGDVPQPGMTLLPGLIDAHSHLLLHPYNEALWDDQVLRESFALRVCRATKHARDNLMSGFTTLRDLGTDLGDTLQESLCNGSRSRFDRPDLI